MKRILCALPLLGLAGCVTYAYISLPAVEGPVLIEESETMQTYTLVERSRDVLRLSVYTLDRDVEIFHRKWERREAPDDEAPDGFRCLQEKAYYMNDEEGMEVVLTDDDCNRTVDSVYFPFQGEFGRGLMSDSQRQQADEGMQQIITDLGEVFDFTAEVDEWHKWKQEAE
ncbi:MAG: hypothetical protein QME12_08905 [Nanoarchaeota archaeon]|nr:hypothetical protein [Nanoarchaeota archaeon]